MSALEPKPNAGLRLVSVFQAPLMPDAGNVPQPIEHVPAVIISYTSHNRGTVSEGELLVGQGVMELPRSTEGPEHVERLDPNRRTNFKERMISRHFARLPPTILMVAFRLEERPPTLALQDSLAALIKCSTPALHHFLQHALHLVNLLDTFFELFQLRFAQ